MTAALHQQHAREIAVGFAIAFWRNFSGLAALSCSADQTYKLPGVVSQESGALVAGIEDCDIDGHSCSLESRTASITTSGLVPFNVSIIFSYYLGHESTEHQVTMSMFLLLCHNYYYSFLPL